MRSQAGRAGSLEPVLLFRERQAHTAVRVGLEYYNGHSALTQFFQERDHYLGFGFWLHF